MPAIRRITKMQREFIKIKLLGDCQVDSHKLQTGIPHTLDSICSQNIHAT